MFLRRNKVSIFQRAREFFWPTAGWHRSTRYVFHRVARIPGSAYSLAAGFACGAAISFTPFLGLHFVLSALLAYIMRANIIASAIGTVVGNPWTFPFIWVGVFNVGNWILLADGIAAQHVNFLEVLTESMRALHELNFAYLFDTAWPVLLPMLVGCVPVSIVAWILFYFLLRPMISKYQAGRHHRRTRKAHRREMKRQEVQQREQEQKS